MTLLELLKKIHDNNNDVDLNSILDLAARNMGYTTYGLYVTDDDLKRGLMIMDENNTKDFRTSVNGCYQGTLI